LNDLTTFTLSSFFSIIIFVIGFAIGERQSKSLISNVGHNLSEKVLDALKLTEQGKLEYTNYNRVTGNFEVDYPDSTTSG